MAREQGRAGGYRSAAASRAGGNGQDRLMTSILIEGSGKMAGDRSGRRQIRTATDQDGSSEQSGADPTVTDQQQRSG